MNLLLEMPDEEEIQFLNKGHCEFSLMFANA